MEPSSPLPPPLRTLEERLAHRFADPQILLEALTHPSTAQGKERKAAAPDNERLEFLGDAVLQLAVTERLYALFPEAPEGQLTPWRASLVSRARMADLATRLGLGDLLSMSRGEERNGGRTRQSILANAMEAVFGAVFRDAGWEAARKVILHLLDTEIAHLHAAPQEAAAINAKGELQELLQREGKEAPRYLCLKEEGASHDRFYEVLVTWKGLELARGTGKSKHEAEFAAAAEALKSLAKK
ncbi:ribonuclease-3 [Verrucomicrobium sp. GAS474]|uniref:ribonuclease III n=1 Tax=Verrucomicrobium sp. GAS474 TaxID=1882831 RepID=UPI00087DE916|nr:ribonuclease III [Verrucomicrobium sp. GAS474]SDT85863.1 ribonuclease-3 [Verrucomicrobium sp. GAS474]